MPNINISVADKVATVTSDSAIVCGNSDYTISFDFDEEWDDYPAKTVRLAYCKGGKRQYKDVLFDGDEVTIPALYGINEVAIGVYAGSIRTTTPAVVACDACIADGDPVHDPPTLDVYNQLMRYLDALLVGTPSGVPVPMLTGAIGGVVGIPEAEEE